MVSREAADCLTLVEWGLTAMKIVNLAAGLVGVALLGIAVTLAATNPKQEAFEEFAVQRIREDACKKAPLGLASQCPKFVDDNQSEIKKVITRNTDRQDYLVFSFYQTDLSVRAIVPDLAFLPGMPTYHFETVGLFGKFYLYEAKQK